MNTKLNQEIALRSGPVRILSKKEAYKFLAKPVKEVVNDLKRNKK